MSKFLDLKREQNSTYNTHVNILSEYNQNKSLYTSRKIYLGAFKVVVCVCIGLEVALWLLWRAAIATVCSGNGMILLEKSSMVHMDMDISILSLT